ncbi:MAG: O-antigen ligase family protein [Clostridia bacterium]
MINIFKNSLLFKFFVKIIYFYKQGFIYKSTENIKERYKFSKTKILWNNFTNSESLVYSSFYNKIVMQIERFFEFLGFLYENSFLCKIFNFFVNTFLKIATSSFILKPFVKIGFKGTLLLIFGLYLPIDYFLRSVLKVYFLASVWDELLMIGFFITVIYRIALKKSPKTSKTTPLDSYIFLFLTAGLFLMCYVSPIFSIAFDGYRAVVQYILWFFVIVRLIENDDDFKILYNTFVGLIIFLGIHCIYQFIIAVEVPASWTSETEYSVRTRVFSLTGSPNIMGALIVLLTPMVTAYFYTGKNLFIKLTAGFFTVMLCFAVLFTFSKGAWVGMAVAVIIFAIFVDRRILSLLLMAGAFVVIAVPSVTNRITYLFTSDYAEASAVGGRTLRWAFGFELLEQCDAFFGFGLGRFGGAVAMQNQVIEITDDFEYFYMDNYYLKTLVEMGYMGLFFYLLLLVAFLVLSVKAIGRIYNTELYIPCVAMFSGMCGVLIHCYFENIFEVPYMTGYFWAMAGMIMYAGFIKKRKNNLN